MHAHAQNLLDVLWGKQKLDTSIDFNSINTYLDEEPGQDFEGFLKITEFSSLFKAAFFFDNCEICIHPELFSWSKIFLKLYDDSKTKTGKNFFL